jgi:hypothetical protein
LVGVWEIFFSFFPKEIEGMAEAESAFHGSDMAVGAVIHGNAPMAALAFHEEGEVIAAGSTKSSLYIIDALGCEVHMSWSFVVCIRDVCWC